MRNKFEQLIEYIINEETEKANELFHNLVVEKSREIYNDLVAEEMQDDMEEDDDQNMDATEGCHGVSGQFCNISFRGYVGRNEAK